MAFNNAFTAVVGATYTAAQYNTHVRDNFTAVWVYTSAGDIVYATSATALARLAKGTAYQHLRMNAGATAPEWGGYIAGMAFRGSNQSLTSGSPANVQFASAPISRLVTWSGGDNTKLSIGASGLFVIGFSCKYEDGGAAGYRETNILWNGSAKLLETRLPPLNGDTMFVCGSKVSPFASGDYIQLQVLQNSGITLNLTEAYLYVAFVGA